MAWPIYGQWWTVEENFYMRRKAAVFLRLTSNISNWKTKIYINAADATGQPMVIHALA